MHGPADILGHLDQMVGQSHGTMIERSAAQVPQRRYRPTPMAQQKALPLSVTSRKPESVPAGTPWAGISCPQGRKLDRLAAPVCLPNRHQPSPHSAIDAHWLRTAARQHCVWKLHDAGMRVQGRLQDNGDRSRLVTSRQPLPNDMHHRSACHDANFDVLLQPLHAVPDDPVIRVIT